MVNNRLRLQFQGFLQFICCSITCHIHMTWMTVYLWNSHDELCNYLIFNLLINKSPKVFHIGKWASLFQCSSMIIHQGIIRIVLLSHFKRLSQKKVLIYHTRVTCQTLFVTKHQTLLSKNPQCRLAYPRPGPNHKIHDLKPYNFAPNHTIFWSNHTILFQTIQMSF